MVADLVHFGILKFEAGGVDAPAIAEVHEPSGFIDREDGFDAVAEARRHMPCIISERLRGFAGPPPADPVLERLRQIPMIQAQPRFDAGGQQFVD